ncbi:ABC transporter permease [Burkholderia pseudomallei]|uniref:ABC transporter permease n=1 Tax=Burkholderia pseudomallei TaxID=28450 RepID=UPI000A1A0F6B|nr:ABC transporter permease [Burkholderia pseudomallei]ARL91019.1 ABC transporter permease [Burkholderia pseudomallei]
MTTSADIRALFVQALFGQTSAGNAVYSPFDWPTNPSQYPLILVHARKERKVSLGPNTPEFDVYTTVEIIARVRAPAGMVDTGSVAALAGAETLKLQIEATLINNPDIWADPAGGQRIEQFTSVDSEINTSSEGEMPIAELAMSIEVKFYQGPEDFFPIPVHPLTTVNVNVDTAAPFDPNGTYANPPFPSAVNPAPRTSGPDGRNEGALTISLPQ